MFPLRKTGLGLGKQLLAQIAGGGGSPTSASSGLGAVTPRGFSRGGAVRRFAEGGEVDPRVAALDEYIHPTSAPAGYTGPVNPEWVALQAALNDPNETRTRNQIETDIAKATAARILQEAADREAAHQASYNAYLGEQAIRNANPRYEDIMRRMSDTYSSANNPADPVRQMASNRFQFNKLRDRFNAGEFGPNSTDSMGIGLWRTYNRLQNLLAADGTPPAPVNSIPGSTPPVLAPAQPVTPLWQLEVPSPDWSQERFQAYLTSMGQTPSQTEVAAPVPPPAPVSTPSTPTGDGYYDSYDGAWVPANPRADWESAVETGQDQYTSNGLIYTMTPNGNWAVTDPNAPVSTGTGSTAVYDPPYGVPTPPGMTWDSSTGHWVPEGSQNPVIMSVQSTDGSTYTSPSPYTSNFDPADYGPFQNPVNISVESTDGSTYFDPADYGPFQNPVDISVQSTDGSTYTEPIPFNVDTDYSNPADYGPFPQNDSTNASGSTGNNTTSGTDTSNVTTGGTNTSNNTTVSTGSNTVTNNATNVSGPTTPTSGTLSNIGWNTPNFGFASGGLAKTRNMQHPLNRIRVLREYYDSPQEAIRDFTMRRDPAASILRGPNDPILSYAFGDRAGGRRISGPGDGLSDSIQGNIDGNEPATLSDGEYVVPADAVSHLGNGSTDAGARQLDQMVQGVRQARTGRAEQAPPVDPRQVLGRMI